MGKEAVDKMRRCGEVKWGNGCRKLVDTTAFGKDIRFRSERRVCAILSEGQNSHYCYMMQYLTQETVPGDIKFQVGGGRGGGGVSPGGGRVIYSEPRRYWAYFIRVWLGLSPGVVYFGAVVHHRQGLVSRMGQVTTT